MRLLGAKTHTITRHSGAYDAEDVWQDAAPQTLAVNGTLLPMRAHELEMLAEGLRTRGAWTLRVLHGQPELRTAAPGGGTLADRLAHEGRMLEVHSVTDYTAHTSGLPHRKYVLVEVGGDES